MNDSNLISLDVDSSSIDIDIEDLLVVPIEKLKSKYSMNEN